MYKRRLEAAIARYASEFRAILINGPRQSGKTTLVQQFFKDKPYFSFENPTTRENFQADPQGFVEKCRNGAIFDEVQKVPELLSYLQEVLDQSQERGRFVLTGSQNFAISNTVSQSLAGRVGVLTLLPMSCQELVFNQIVQETSPEKIFNGGYPELFLEKPAHDDFFASYISTYVERDIRDLKSIQNTTTFKIFIKLCAGRVGQPLNYSSLAIDANISVKTAQDWVSLLAASYIVFLVAPYYKNFNKRLVKMPKLYFYDTGLLCYLLGLKNSAQVEDHFAKGQLFENLAILEIVKSFSNQGKSTTPYFWKNQTGHEVDYIVENYPNTLAMEIKFSKTPKNEFFKNLNYFQELEPTTKKFLIYDGQAGSWADATLLSVDEISQTISNECFPISTQK